MRLIVAFCISIVLSLPATARGQSPREPDRAKQVSEDVALKTKFAIDGQGNLIRDSVIVVRAGRIVAVQPNGQVPAGAREVDLTKFTVMPGMIDMHVHIAAHFDESNRERPSITAFWGADNARKYLESGFTTVRSLGAPNLVDVDLRNAINSGLSL